MLLPLYSPRPSGGRLQRHACSYRMHACSYRCICRVQAAGDSMNCIRRVRAAGDSSLRRGWPACLSTGTEEARRSAMLTAGVGCLLPKDSLSTVTEGGGLRLGGLLVDMEASVG